MALASGCSGPTLEVLERKPTEFVEASGERLHYQGRPFRFLSVNAFTLTGCGFADDVPDDAERDAFFAALRPRSVVRTYAFENYGLDGVEKALRSAEAHGHLLTLVLTDHEGSCGEGDADRTGDWYESGFRASYLPWVRTVVSRFEGDPAIAFWEPVKGPRDIDASTLRNFFDVVGGEIHAIDSNHLVEAGTHGPWAYGGEAGYALVMESAGIDVASFHDYDNMVAVPVNLEPALRALSAVRKPIVASEMGMFAAPEGDPSQQYGGYPCISWNERRETFSRQLEAAFATPLSGVQIWNWMPSSTNECAFSVPYEDPLFRLVHDFPIPEAG